MNRFNMKKGILIGVVILIVALTWVFNREEEVPSKLVKDLDTNLVTYTNEAYNFSLEFPNTWNLFEDFESGSPIINIYKRVPGINPPYDHFSAVPHVSIYPNGLPTEGLVGEIVDVTESQKYINEDVAEVGEYVLDNGDVWARFITFKKVPKSWQSWGFVWARGEVKEYEEFCFSNGEEISVYECNVFNGDEIVRGGNISNGVNEIELEILKSFRFLK